MDRGGRTMHPTAAYRLNRLFKSTSGRLLDVAVDHGFFGEPSFLSGIEDMPRVIDTLVAAGPDAKSALARKPT